VSRKKDGSAVKRKQGNGKQILKITKALKSTMVETFKRKKVKAPEKRVGDLFGKDTRIDHPMEDVEKERSSECSSSGLEDNDEPGAFRQEASYFEKAAPSSKRQTFRKTNSSLRSIQAKHKSANIRLFAQLKNPSDREIRDHLLKSKQVDEKTVNNILATHFQRFSRMYWLLMSGFNVVFYGFGSKKRLLESFAEAIENFERKKGPENVSPVIVGFGYSPAFNLFEFLKKIAEGYLLLNKHAFEKVNTVESLCNLIIDLMTAIVDVGSPPLTFRGIHVPSEAPAWTKDIFVIMHNIDGRSLRRQNIKNTLSKLATSPKIRFVASVDHIHAPMLWDQRQSERFNWIWEKANTFDTYFHETVNVDSVVTRRDTGSQRGVGFVLSSLTPNHISVLQTLARYHLQSDGSGMEFSELFEECRTNMFVTSEQALRQLLLEFTDHSIVNLKRLSNGVETVHVSLDDDIIKSEILHQEKGQE